MKMKGFCLITLFHCFIVSPYCCNGFVFPCYYIYDPSTLTPEAVPLDLCTHIILIGCIDESNLVAEPYTKGVNCTEGLLKLSSLRQRNPNLILLISVGSTDAMHKIVQNETLMDKYTDSAINLVKYFNFQGLDYDWEFPCDGNDRFLFTQLLQMIRKKTQTIPFLLTAAIGAGIDLLEKCYDLEGLINNLDFMNVMSYNYNSIYNTYTAYSSPLYARPEETGSDATLNTNSTVHYLLDHNVPKSKIVVGSSGDGHTFQLADKNINGFHANVTGVGYGGGWAYFSQMCKLMLSGGTGVYDDVAEVLYVYYEDQWVNAGDVRSSLAKANYVKNNQLGGVFTFALNLDDLNNVCGFNIPFPFHQAIKSVLFPKFKI